MSALEIAKAAHLRGRFRGADHNAFEPASRPLLQRINQRMRRLADGNHKYVAVGIQVVEVIANPGLAAFTTHVPLKGAFNARLRQSPVEELPGCVAHLRRKLLTVEWQTR